MAFNPGKFLREVRTESAKIVWPTRRETLMTGLMVVIMTSLLALFFFGIDALFSAIVKFLLAWRLPLFVDEAFYVWESRHLAWAYSDLPGLTAWLIRAGTTLGGQAELAVRLPFLLIGASLPWWVVRLAARWFGEEQGWRAGLLALRRRDLPA